MSLTDINNKAADDGASWPHMQREGWRTRAQWKVPALFCNDWTCLKVAAALRERCGGDVLRSAYGAPACAWAGGRPSLVKERQDVHDLRRRFDAYRRLGMDVSLTLSWRHVDPETLIQELVSRGFVRLKIAGRGLTPLAFACEVLGPALGNADPADILSPEDIMALKMMSLASSDPLLRICLPQE